MKQHVKGSSQAELYAIANALHIVSRDYDLSKYRVIVYADNLWALGHTQGKCNQETSPVYRKYIRPHIRKAAIFEPRHVKAHLEPQKWSKRSARHYMQDWCDQEVHRLMKVATKERLALQSAIDLQKNKQKS